MHTKSLLAAILATSASAALDAPIPGYSVFVPRWEAPGADGEPPLVLRGTVEQVVHSFDGMNPNWDADAARAGGARRVRDLHLDARAAFGDGDGVLCHNFREGNRSAVEVGVEYLRKVPMKPVNGAGPANCGRVSCRNNTGIWWCNDATTPKELNSFSDIADGAQRVLGGCKDKLDANQGDGMTVSGQAFHRDGWNVVVRGGDDCADAGVNINARRVGSSREF